jgi:hypothetical protein
MRTNTPVYLRIYGLFNDIVSSSEYTGLYDRMRSE